jgi:hypothetical protein
MQCEGHATKLLPMPYNNRPFISWQSLQGSEQRQLTDETHYELLHFDVHIERVVGFGGE